MPEQDGADLELTIVMPCLNEAETLERCVRKALGFLAEEGVSGEVVVADNGSTDGSQAIAAEGGARVVHVEEKGYGSALLGGISAARGRFVIMGDADAVRQRREWHHLDRLMAPEEVTLHGVLMMGFRRSG